ncbi:MAG: methyltransferase domain-containing protein [Chloroflexota bacterium]
MNNYPVLSQLQAEALLKARQEQEVSAEVSPDLGLSTAAVSLSSEGVFFPGGEQAAWGAVEKIAGADNKCFVIRGGAIHDIKTFSEHTNLAYSLYATEGAPTMLISGFPMHRIKGTDPHRDTLEKIKALAPVVGRVLDTTTGLGYTAIEAAKTAGQVITIEIDPAALEIARQNPWSQALFNNPKITQLVGSSFEKIKAFDEGSFSRIIHDPPTLKLAGDLYSAAFYRELYRVLALNGQLFHYIGNPESKTGSTTTKGVIRRLREVGFKKVNPKPKAFGVTAYK